MRCWRKKAAVGAVLLASVLLVGCSQDNPFAQGAKDVYDLFFPKETVEVVPDSVSGLYSTQNEKNQYVYLSLKSGSYIATLYASNQNTQIDKESGTYTVDEENGVIELTEVVEPSYRITKSTAPEDENSDPSVLTSHTFRYDAEADTAELIDENGMVLTKED